MFIFAKTRESNHRERREDEVQGSFRGCHFRDGDNIPREETSEAQQHPELFAGPAFRPYYWSCSQQFFIRPEESFLAAMSSSVRGAVSPAPDWMRAAMPTQCTVALTPSFHPRGPGGGAGGGGAVCSDTNWSKGRRSCSGDASVPVRKMVRFRCHTCAEKLPTLNSLRTHLKSHSRPAPLTLPAALRCDQHLMPSATVVTSKYGRRRAVVSALVAIKPTRR